MDFNFNKLSGFSIILVKWIKRVILRKYLTANILSTSYIPSTRKCVYRLQVESLRQIYLLDLRVEFLTNCLKIGCLPRSMKSRKDVGNLVKKLKREISLEYDLLHRNFNEYINMSPIF